MAEEYWKERLDKFYAKYQPDKASSIPALLKKVNGNSGNFEKLIEQLVSKYGPEPESDDDASEDESVENEEQSEQSESDQGSELNEKLVRRVRTFYDFYNKEKLSTVEDLVRRTRQKPKYEQRLMKLLVRKYGPEPKPEEKSEIQPEIDEFGLKKHVYCPVDMMPPEYSEYLQTFPQALPWLLENVPGLRLATRDGMTVKEFCDDLEQNGLSFAEGVSKSKRGGAARPNKSVKFKKSEPGDIVIEKLSRGKKKITQIFGLDSYEIKLKQAAKKLGKKFACSATVSKHPNNTESVDLQGDCSYELPEALAELFPDLIPQDSIHVKDGGKKSKSK